MTPSDDLHQLIASMDKNEKRYCRLALTRGVGKEATRARALFDAVAAMRSYDEALLRRKLKGGSAERHLAVAKHHLYLLLLRHLHAYQAGRDPRNKVRDLLDGVAVLRDRGLLAQGGKLNARAMALARRYELFAEQIESLELELDTRLYQASPPAVEAARLFDAIDDVHGRSGNYHQYHRLSETITAMLLYDGKPRNAAEQRRYDEIMRHPLLRDPGRATSLDARRLYHDCWRIYYLAVRDYERGYRNSLESIALLETPEARAIVNWIDYPVILYTHITICISLGKLEEAEDTYRKLQKIPKGKGLRAVKLKQMEYNAFIGIAGARRDYRTVARQGPAIMAFLDENTTLLSQQMLVSIPFIVAFMQFLSGEYRNAMRTLGPLISETYGGIRSDYQLLTQLLRMMIHFETGDYDLIPYLWRSTYRSLKKKNALHRFERVILDFLRKLPDATTAGKRRDLFAEAREKLTELRDDPNEEEIVTWFNIVPWLDTKIRPGRQKEGATTGSRRKRATR